MPADQKLPLRVRRPTHTPRRPISVSDDLWDEFGQLVGDRNRSKVLREFMAAYVGRPGAKMPKRPKVSDTADQGEHVDRG